MFFGMRAGSTAFFRKKAKNRKKIEKKGLHFPKSRDILSNVPSEQVNTTRGISTVGSALHSHCRGQRFESAMLHQTQEIRTSSRLGMGSDFFFLSEKLNIHNKKRHCGKYRFQDFKPPSQNCKKKQVYKLVFGRVHAKISTWAKEAQTAVHPALTVKFLPPTSMIMQGEHTDGRQPRIKRDDFPELRRAL